MADPFLAEIRIASFNFAPQGWAFCNGQFLPINQNQALFSLLGTTYGGNGQTTFALPDLRSRTPIHMGNGHVLGEKAGEQAHTLSISELTQHVHSVVASTDVQDNLAPNGRYLGRSTPLNFYSGTATVAMHPSVITNTGGSQPHQNMQPYLTLSFCIALQGIFPSQN